MDMIHKDQIKALGHFFGQTIMLYSDFAKQEGISYNKSAILISIFDYEEVTQRKICAEWGLPKQTVSTLCKSFEQDGFIAYKATSNDNREKYLVMTEKRRTEFQSLMNKLNAVESYAFQKMGKEQVELMLNGMKQFSQAFAEGLKEVNK